MATARTVTSLVDRLQTELDNYIGKRRELIESHNRLLIENEALKDKIAELMAAKANATVGH